jgi:hypothetical protein
MSPRRYFSQFNNMPVPDHLKDLNLGPNMWFAFTAISGLSRLFTYTPDFLEADKAAQAAGDNDKTITDSKSGIEDSPDNNLP